MVTPMANMARDPNLIVVFPVQAILRRNVEEYGGTVFIQVSKTLLSLLPSRH